MLTAQQCREQAARSLLLTVAADSKAEADLLRNISHSWTRLAGQMERYETLLRQRQPMLTRLSS